LPISVSQFVKVSAKKFDQTGAFDAILDVDSRLFIDPHLLPASKAPELSTSYSKVKDRFTHILKLLEKSRVENDPFWRAAFGLFHFPELEGLCIGYSADGTRGSGMGPGLRKRILRTAKLIVDEGVKDTEIFELVGLFENDIGPDRISDMVGRIVIEDLQKYTERILKSLKVKTSKIAGSPYQSIRNPYNRKPLILVPSDILRDLPIANDWSDIDYVCQFNEALRKRVNAFIGDTWKKATRAARKSDLRFVLLSEPDVLRDLIKLYKKKPATVYDYNNDPSGEFIWFRASRQATQQFPLKIKLPKTPTATDVETTVKTICEKFRDLIENNALSSLLYNDSTGKPKKEEAAQKLFYGIADSYCEANNLDLSREANAGRGPVDFKVSKGYKGRVVVEAKLTSNPQLLHGFEVQIEEYQKAEKTKTAIYLVIDVSKSRATRNRITKLKALIRTSKASGKRMPEVIFVDGLRKLSASKYIPT
jgi:hypothetical protein